MQRNSKRPVPGAFLENDVLPEPYCPSLANPLATPDQGANSSPVTGATPTKTFCEYYFDETRYRDTISEADCATCKT